MASCRRDARTTMKLGLCHLMKGDSEEARRWTTKAKRVAETDEQRHRYSNKIKALML